MFMWSFSQSASEIPPSFFSLFVSDVVGKVRPPLPYSWDGLDPTSGELTSWVCSFLKPAYFMLRLPWEETAETTEDSEGLCVQFNEGWLSGPEALTSVESLFATGSECVGGLGATDGSGSEALSNGSACVGGRGATDGFGNEVISKQTSESSDGISKTGRPASSSKECALSLLLGTFVRRRSVALILLLATGIDDNLMSLDCIPSAHTSELSDGIDTTRCELVE